MKNNKQRTRTRTRRLSKGVVAQVIKDNKVLTVTDTANSTFVQAATRTLATEEKERSK